MAGFVALAVDDFKRRLPEGFRPHRLEGTRELIFGRPLRADRRGPPELFIVVFTTIGLDGESRDSGKDAIRVGLMHGPSGKLLLSVGRVNRVGAAGAVLDRVIERIRAVERKGRSETCPLCGAPLIELSRPDGRRFLGCSQFRVSGCRHTRPFPS